MILCSVTLDSTVLRANASSMKGLAFTAGPGGEVYINFSSHITMTEGEDFTISIPFSEVERPPSPWKKHIAESRAVFNEDQGLEGNVLTRIWGLASSPMGDKIAFSYSLHPSDMVEYAIYSDEQCHVAVAGAIQPGIEASSINESGMPAPACQLGTSFQTHK